MKTHLRPTVICALLAAVSAVHAAPGIDVTVATASGKLAYRGKTAANGTFSTGKLQPGNYIIQFNSNNGAMESGNYALVVSAGKKKVTAESVTGEKFGKGGVAMKVDVGPGLNITGQVAEANRIASLDPLRVKVVNGKKFYWAKEVGSNLFKWVEEGTPEAGNVIRSNQEGFQRMQDNGQGRAR